MPVVSNNSEKSFHHFLKLLPEVRTKIIDKFEPDDRCRFTRCSKLCSVEAMASKNYIFEFSLCCWNDEIYIRVIYEKYEPEDEYHQGFQLAFYETNGRKLKTYTSLEDMGSYETELASSTNLFDFGIAEFKRRISIYQYSVKSLVISGDPFGNSEVFKNVDFGIVSLNNLENLEVQGETDIRQFLTKLRKPLKTLHFDGNDFAADCEQIYQVQEKLVLPDVVFEALQFERITAKHAVIYVRDLNEKHIFKFIRSWQDGTVGREIVKYIWTHSIDEVDIEKLFRRMRIKVLRREAAIEIKHYIELGKSALLQLQNGGIEFIVDHDGSE